MTIPFKKYFLILDKLWTEKSSFAYSEYSFDPIYNSFKDILDSAGMVYLPPMHIIEKVMQKQITEKLRKKIKKDG